MEADESSETDVTWWRRWSQRFVGAGRWALDVFRGHARSRHLDNRET